MATSWNGECRLQPEMTIASIQVGRTRTMIDLQNDASPSWKSSYIKEPQSEVWVGKTKLTGDSQTDLQNHGGFNRVILGYAAEHYKLWAKELGLTFPFGAFAENLTIQGMSERNACIGDVYQVGKTIIQISEPRIPCWKISKRWNIEDLLERVIDTGRTGWFFRTLQEGEIKHGQTMILLERPYPKITISEINDVLIHRTKDLIASSAIADCTLLSDDIRELFYKRLGDSE